MLLITFGVLFLGFGAVLGFFGGVGGLALVFFKSLYCKNTCNDLAPTTIKKQKQKRSIVVSKPVKKLTNKLLFILIPTKSLAYKKY